MNTNNVYEAPKSQLESGLSRNELENLLVIAKRQKSLLLTFLVYFLVAGYSGTAGPELKLILQLAAIPLMIAVVILTARLSWRLYGRFGAVSMIALSLFPLVNLIILLIVNSKANTVLKKAGFRVGLAGASTKEIAAAI
ncbi:hypothetical protein ACJJIL_12630 [Microbulbifer sp. EKSA005]|uniref:hypothetical protein n=1 Tax=Microbulbifer sp. EKSA005 TaxID=3243364 RepID=UPI004043823F